MMGVQELKHAAKLREWSEKVAECRTSGKGVRAWCADRGVSTKTYYHWEKLVVMQAAQNNMLPSPTHNGQLMRIEPETLPGEDTDSKGGGITIRHGESVVILPLGSSVEAAAMLVKAPNSHA